MALQKRVDSIVPKTKLGDLFKRHVVDKVTADQRERGASFSRSWRGFGADSSHVLAESDRQGQGTGWRS